MEPDAGQRLKVVLFGATGMVGQGVLRECLLSPGIESVLAVGRQGTGLSHPKLREIEHRDFTDFTPLGPRLTGIDACLYCLGITSVGKSESEYARVTRDYALAAATVLVERNPGMTFVFVSGAGADSSEGPGPMWARVKGQTENALRRLPFRAVHVLRPGVIQPQHGIRSRTRAYRLAYTLLGPLLPLLKRLFPGHLTTTGQVARAMIRLAASGAPSRTLQTRDINAWA